MRKSDMTAHARDFATHSTVTGGCHWSSIGEIAAYILTLIIMGSFDFGVTRGLIMAGVTAGWSKAWASVVGFFGNYILRRVLVFGRGGAHHKKHGGKTA